VLGVAQPASIASSTGTATARVRAGERI
jgi:hypothetical protein